LNIHEYQAKELFRQYGVAVPAGKVIRSPAEAGAAAEELISSSGNPVVVLKSQIHAGGRGLGRFREHPDLGGVQVITDGIKGGSSAAAARAGKLAEQMLGSTLVTVQTGEDGKQVNTLYLEQGIDIARELYLSIVLDRSTGRNLVMASTEGGMEIEEVAEATPEKILQEVLDPLTGLAPFQVKRLGYGLGLAGDALRAFSTFLGRLADAAVELDADMLEINPLVITGSDEVVALDGKVSIDDNALFRHPELMELRDLTEEDPAETEAGKYGMSFIKLDGNIGCLVNGAGLAMATMDIIKHVGGEPANFLDVGGGATAENVTAAFKLITRDENVRGIFINIFGGIMKCDTIANGVVTAVREVGLHVPLVVRLEGTNVAEGRKIIDESGLNVVSATDMLDGAQKIVELAGGSSS